MPQEDWRSEPIQPFEGPTGQAAQVVVGLIVLALLPVSLGLARLFAVT